MSPFREVTMLSTATKALVGVMAAQMSAAGVHHRPGAGDSRGHGGFFFDRVFLPLMLRKVYEDKDRQEDQSAPAHSIDHRPAHGAERQAGSWPCPGIDGPSDVHGGTISRADVADFVVQQLKANTWLRSAADHLVMAQIVIVMTLPRRILVADT
jgi:hypothetical protein